MIASWPLRTLRLSWKAPARVQSRGDQRGADSDARRVCLWTRAIAPCRIREAHPRLGSAPGADCVQPVAGTASCPVDAPPDAIRKRPLTSRLATSARRSSTGCACSREAASIILLRTGAPTYCPQNAFARFLYNCTRQTFKESIKNPGATGRSPHSRSDSKYFQAVPPGPLSCQVGPFGHGLRRFPGCPRVFLCSPSTQNETMPLLVM